MKDLVCSVAIRISSLVLVLSLLGTGAMAQSQGSQPKTAPAAAPCPCCQPMLPGGELVKLVDQVAKSSAALAKETDPTVLKKKVAEHDTLVKSLQTKFQEHSQMMQKMMAGGGCCGAGCSGTMGKMPPGMKM